MEQKLYEGDAIAPLAFPNCEIAVREFLRSGEQRLVRDLGLGIKAFCNFGAGYAEGATTNGSGRCWRQN